MNQDRRQNKIQEIFWKSSGEEHKVLKKKKKKLWWTTVTNKEQFKQLTVIAYHCKQYFFT